MYNALIADHHTYFVSDEGWGWEVWSHNVCQLHHFVSVALGSQIRRGSAVLTRMGSLTHRALHRALSLHLEKYTSFSARKGKIISMNPKRGQSGREIQSAFSSMERIEALYDFYSTYRSGRYLSEFVGELGQTLTLGAFR